MNIFLLDFNPRKAAEHHCDKHVVKMILETAQLLYSAHWVVDPSVLAPGAYRKTHVNHPCAVWTRESIDNYLWLCELGLSLCEEYTFRYGKIHKTQAHIVWLTVHAPVLPAIGVTEIRLAMPVQYKLANPVLSYQKYYRDHKMPLGFLKYTNRSMPSFLECTSPASTSNTHS